MDSRQRVNSLFGGEVADVVLDDDRGFHVCHFSFAFDATNRNIIPYQRN
jgi:hypothetical protein